MIIAALQFTIIIVLMAISLVMAIYNDYRRAKTDDGVTQASD